MSIKALLLLKQRRREEAIKEATNRTIKKLERSVDSKISTTDRTDSKANKDKKNADTFKSVLASIRSKNKDSAIIEEISESDLDAELAEVEYFVEEFSNHQIESAISKLKYQAVNEELSVKLKCRKKIRELESLSINTKILNPEQRNILNDILGKEPENVDIPVKLSRPDNSNDSDNSDHGDVSPIPVVPAEEKLETPVADLNKNQITKDILNDQQLEAVEMSGKGKSFVLIGGAGSGKTTTQQFCLSEVEEKGILGRISDQGEHKKLFLNSPAVAICSFTNKAVENIRTVAPQAFKRNCMTIHKLLQYRPVKELREVLDDQGNTVMREVRIFEPTFSNDNPLPHLDLIVWEESSNVGDILHNLVIDALDSPMATKHIYLGDLNQLPPVIGKPILAEKMLELPVVALEKVYRQATDSPIKSLAMDILEGHPLNDKRMEALHEPERGLSIQKFPKYYPSEHLLVPLRNMFRKHIATDAYVEGRDIILTPNNAAENMHINMVNMNLIIADIFREIHNREIWEVQVGYNKLYLAVDDIVIYQKKSWKITAITFNSEYQGLPTRQPSTNIDRYGQLVDETLESGHGLDLEDFLNSGDIKINMSTTPDDGEKVNRLSHIVSLISTEDTEDGEMPESCDISVVGDTNDFAFGYALTVHKSQGSEWDNVFLILHHEAGNMACRELLYTAITRAKKNLEIRYDGEQGIIGKFNTSWFQKGILNQQIPGRTVADKLEYFKQLRDTDMQTAELKSMLADRRRAEADKKEYGE